MSLTIMDNSHVYHKDVVGNVRKAQEDSHDIAASTPNGDVFVVCDGMGGHVGGKQASSIAVKCIVDYLKKEKHPQPARALNDALRFANMQILGYANEHPELRGMGTTACIVLLQDSEAYIAHIGDSRIYLYLGKEKQLHRITKDHSFVQTLVDAGRITDEQAEHHPDKNRILKALGIKPDLQPSFGRVRPKNGDVFLICSDGLSGMVPDSTMRDVLMQDTCLWDKGEALVGLALKAGGLDNITLELVQIAGSPHKRSMFKSYNPAIYDRDAPSLYETVWRRVMIVLSVIVLCAAVGFLIRYGVNRRKEPSKNQTMEVQTRTDVAQTNGECGSANDRARLIEVFYEEYAVMKPDFAKRVCKRLKYDSPKDTADAMVTLEKRFKASDDEERQKIVDAIRGEKQPDDTKDSGLLSTLKGWIRIAQKDDE